MSIDVRTRLSGDARPLGLDEILDDLVPGAIAAHGDLAARGLAYQALPALGLELAGGAVTLAPGGGTIRLQAGTDDAGVVVSLDAEALSDLLQDVHSTMGLAMTSRVKITTGDLNDWIG